MARLVAGMTSAESVINESALQCVFVNFGVPATDGKDSNPSGVCMNLIHNSESCPSKFYLVGIGRAAAKPCFWDCGLI